MQNATPKPVSKEELKDWHTLAIATQVAEDPKTLKITSQQFARMQVVLFTMAEVYENKTGKPITEEAIVSPPDWLIDETIKQTSFPEVVVVACTELIPYHIEELLN